MLRRRSRFPRNAVVGVVSAVLLMPTAATPAYRCQPDASKGWQCETVEGPAADGTSASTTPSSAAPEQSSAAPARSSAAPAQAVETPSGSAPAAVPVTPTVKPSEPSAPSADSVPVPKAHPKEDVSTSGRSGAGAAEPANAPPSAAAETSPATAGSKTEASAESAAQSATKSQAESVAPPIAPAASLARPAHPEARDAALMDWVPRGELTIQQAAPLAPYCSGAYREPAVPNGLDEKSSIVGASANSARYEIDQKVVLEGDVRFTHRLSQMSTQMATYDVNSEKVSLVGQVMYRQPGLLILGEDAQMVLDPRTADVANASFVLQTSRTRGAAKRVLQNEDGSLTIKQGYMTRCDPGDDAWRLDTEQIDIDTDRQFATTRNAVLRVGDVPIAYVPYLQFPVTDDRHSGFLFPTIGASGNDGVDVSIPYYLNLAPNYDATVTPRWLSNRGGLVEVEGRQLSESMGNVVGGAFLYKDDDYNGKYSRSQFNDLGISGRFRPKDRWLLSWLHHGHFGPLTSLVDFSAASDLDYFNDLGTDLDISSEAQLDRRAALGLYLGDFSASLSALRIDPLQAKLAEPYRRSPDFSVKYRHPFSSLPLVTQISGQVVQFERDNGELTGVDRFNGLRWFVEPRITIPLQESYGHLIAQLAYNYTGYDLKDVGNTTSERQPHRRLFSGSLDAGLTFERAFDWFDDESVQTIEPRLYYLRVQRRVQDDLPLFDSGRFSFDFAQLFRENRFSGVDRVNDANQLSLALTSRVLNSRTGVERVRASLGRIVHFSDRTVTLGTPIGADETGNSPWAGEIQAALTQGVSVRGSFAFDAREAIEDQTRIELRYGPPPRFDGDQRIAFIGFNRRGKNIREADTAIYWPLSDTWRVIGRFYYDLEGERTLEAFGGVEIDACCYRVRVLARRYLKNSFDPFLAETERGIFLQFVLKGLAGIGSTDRIMEHGIPGYRENDPHLH